MSAPLRLIRLVLLVVVGSCGGLARAHSMWPASLRLVEAPDGAVQSRWEVPLKGGRPLPLHVTYPGSCAPVGAPTISEGARTRRIDQRLDCGDGGLTGKRIAIAGLEQTQSDALVVVEHADGRATSALLHGEAPALAVPAPDAAPPSARRYLAIGVEHIATGLDHVLFVIGLVLLTGRRWGTLLKTVTAFTVTHSVTLALSTLGIVRFPQASVEAVIALSILLLAVEVLRAAPRSWTARAPWAVAGLSGLVHGMGFAGALTRIGLPEHELPAALLHFNVGVEAGQLGVVALTLSAVALARRLRVSPYLRRLPVWAMGSISAFWLLQRASDIVRL